MTLYELTGQFAELLEMMEDPDVDPDVLLDTAEAVELDLNDKADAYAKVISNVNADIDAINAEIQRLQARRSTLTNNVLRLKENLQTAMEKTGKTKFKTALFSFNVQKNPPSVALEEKDVKNIPEKYLRYREPEVNKTALLADLKLGIDLTGIAHIEQSMTLRIR